MAPGSQQSTLSFSSAPRKAHPIPDKASTFTSTDTRDSANAIIASTAPLSSPSSRASTIPPQTLDAAMADLPDSTDWIKTSLPTFEPLEAALRCEVCKEFYENPVITSCSHTFCSLCIRRCISNDGKCPACKTVCQADRLLPNIAVREIVTRFQAARPKALELAKAKESRDNGNEKKARNKRKLDETDIEREEPTRHTRSRTTRSRSRHGDGMADASFEVPDTDDDGSDEGDDAFVPEGMVACPVCKAHMKEAQVWPHLEAGCSDEKKAAGGRSTRSKVDKALSNSLQRSRIDDSPAPSRLPGLNYALLKETALRKKLKELGIPDWGNKPLLIKRHTEWLHLWNSNCDASENRRKTKRDLLSRLNTWEKLHGGHANATDATVMRKDFDGYGHASAYKSQFDDLIANAKRKKGPPKKEENKEETPTVENGSEEVQTTAEQSTDPSPQMNAQPSIDVSRPYEGNEAALASVREKVEQTNQTGTVISPLSGDTSMVSQTSLGPTNHALADIPGIRDPFASPSRKLPMFALPERPVEDIESSTSIQ